uniref:Zinc-ribbon domain-containing protein n=1 Tax=Labrus bergylta TaxID=56723 RepID=A0A3Q3H159_9LABR
MIDFAHHTQCIMFCPDCGNQVQSSFRFCPDCGYKLFLLTQNKAEGELTSRQRFVILCVLPCCHFQRFGSRG